MSGKSSLINALCIEKILHIQGPAQARPGFQFYEINDCIRMVDLPGYGFSKPQNRYQSIQ